jgi:hypothetical protein
VGWEHVLKVTEKFYGWQPSEVKRLKWSEVMDYATHAAIMQQREIAGG